MTSSFLNPDWLKWCLRHRRSRTMSCQVSIKSLGTEGWQESTGCFCWSHTYLTDISWTFKSLASACQNVVRMQWEEFAFSHSWFKLLGTGRRLRRLVNFQGQDSQCGTSNEFWKACWIGMILLQCSLSAEKGMVETFSIFKTFYKPWEWEAGYLPTSQ